MSQMAVGKEVLSFCRKCSLPLAHMIVMMKTDETIGKVKCLTCKDIHAYRDPDKKTTPRKKSTRTTTKKTSENNLQKWQELLAKSSSSDEKGYSPAGAFGLGDYLGHPTFGKGFVVKEMESNKLLVLFEAGEKVLVHKIA